MWRSSVVRKSLSTFLSERSMFSEILRMCFVEDFNSLSFNRLHEDFWHGRSKIGSLLSHSAIILCSVFAVYKSNHLAHVLHLWISKFNRTRTMRDKKKFINSIMKMPIKNISNWQKTLVSLPQDFGWDIIQRERRSLREPLHQWASSSGNISNWLFKRFSHAHYLDASCSFMCWNAWWMRSSSLKNFSRSKRISSPSRLAWSFPWNESSLFCLIVTSIRTTASGLSSYFRRYASTLPILSLTRRSIAHDETQQNHLSV
jgi:hypothetical protein